MFGTLELKSRPIKLGFLVDPNKPASIKQAIEISSSLWGGTYNPIIPVYKRLPKNWEKHTKRKKPEAIVKGYIEAFDPDILVKCTTELPKYLETYNLEIINPNEIWEPLAYDKSDQSPKYGIGIFELYNLVFENHFRYKERYPITVSIPKIPRKNSLFWSSLFGSFPAEVYERITKNYSDALEIKRPKVDPSKLKDLMKGDNQFPRRITKYGLNFLKRSGFLDGDCVFFMDMDKPLDILDYWNLRALGRQVIPAPIQLKDQESLKEIIIQFLKSVRKPLRGNPRIYNHTNFICSRNSNMEDMKEYATSLKIEKDPKDPSDEHFYSLQHWYPRIWDDWARGKDSAEADEIYYEEESIDIADNKNGIRLKFLLPDFIYRYGGFGEPRVANDVSFRLYGSTEAIAQVFPKDGGRKFLHSISGTSLLHEWRVGRNGLVKLVKYQHAEQWNIPVARDVFFAWLEDLGWTPKLSPPGLITQQIFKQLDGFVKPLDDEALLKTLEEMNSGKKSEQGMTVGEIKTRFKKFDKYGNIYKFLTSKNIFRVGLSVQCPNCQRWSWFTLDSLEEKLACPKCLDRYPSIGTIDQSKWSYKTIGPFSISGYADGSYCVLLAMEFFDHDNYSLHITPSYSFEAKDSSGKSLEADFGMLWRDTVFGQVMDGVLFGECKTYGKFEEKDFERMRNIAKNFPGAILVFCTLRKNLTKKEIKEIVKIANPGRKYWKNDRPINPVLILTGNELLSDFGPPYCWEDMGLKKKFEHVYGLLEIADATQQIHLNLPSWKDKWYKDFDKRRKKIQEKQSKQPKK